MAYVPANRVLVRVEIQTPGQQALVRKAQILKQRRSDWYMREAPALSDSDKAKTLRMLNELESLSVQLSSGEVNGAVDRLAQLESWLAALGIDLRQKVATLLRKIRAVSYQRVVPRGASD